VGIAGLEPATKRL